MASVVMELSCTDERMCVVSMNQDVEDYDPRVVEQLMDFVYSYSAEVLQDAEVSG